MVIAAADTANDVDEYAVVGGDGDINDDDVLSQIMD